LGFDLELSNAARSAVTIPVIAANGAGCIEHFFDYSDKGGSRFCCRYLPSQGGPIAAVKII